MLNEFINYAIVHGEESAKSLDYNEINKAYDYIIKIASRLKQLDELHKLVPLLGHHHWSVRTWAATILLTTDNPSAVDALNEISKLSIPYYSFTARMILSEYAQGTLRLPLD